MVTVLLTGAGGYIGPHVVKALLDRGDRVIAVYRRKTAVDPRSIVLEGDFAELTAQQLSQHGVPDVCVHLAWTEGFNHDSPSHIEMLPKHFQFVKTLMGIGIRQFACLGSMHEIGYWEGEIDEHTPTAPRSLYGIAKNALREIARLEVQRVGSVFQWMRAYYILGDDLRNKSIFAKVLAWDAEGRATFPFTSGLNKYDFIEVEQLAAQITAVVGQTEINGIIECCDGKAVSLKDKMQEFIAEHHLTIRPEYGAFPDRPYDSPAVWGGSKKIRRILALNSG